MVNRVIAYASAVTILALGYYQYLSTRRLSEVQKQYGRIADQTQTIKAQEQKIASQQELIESLQHKLQTQNDGLQEQLERIAGELRAQKQLGVAAAEAHHRPTLRIYPLWISRNGAVECSPELGQPCDVFDLGSDVHIGITLTNTSGHPTTYPRWFGPPTFLEIRDQSGQLVSEAEELKKVRKEYPASDGIAVLKPKGQVSWGVQVNKYWDMSRPGTYSIVARLRSDEPNQTWVYSNRVRVTITPKQ